MKNLIKTISIALIFIISCQSNDREKIEVTLRHEKKNDSHLLVMTYKNISSIPVYIPNLGSIELIMDSLRFINSKGEEINSQFINNELNHNISFYGPPIDGNVITNYCSDNPNISEEIDLELPPFDEKKEMVRSIIQHEYENLISEKQFRMPTEEDLRFIRSLIFFKYHNSIFLKPGEKYHDCITINTLFQANETYKIFLHYIPNKKFEKYEHIFKLGKDTLVVNSNLLDNYKKFVLCNEPLVSDTIIINP